jgi:iron complex transport system ATP-binding protein
VLLDEPTSFLDMKHQVKIYDLLKTAQKRKGRTIAAVTHDINLAAQYCDSALLLACGGKYFFGEIEDVFSVERIKKVFDVPVFSGTVGHEKFFLPLGRLAKDSQTGKET